MKFVFIVGGTSSGKTSYAAKHYPEAVLVDDYQFEVRKQLENDLNPEIEVKKMIDVLETDNNYDTIVVISRELGYGLVPINMYDRAYRDVNGRVNCILAERADVVIRMISGCPQIIKNTYRES